MRWAFFFLSLINEVVVVVLFKTLKKGKTVDEGAKNCLSVSCYYLVKVCTGHQQYYVNYIKPCGNCLKLPVYKQKNC